MKITFACIALAVSLVSSVTEAAACSSLYAQCGGVEWKGATCCESGSTCVAQAGNKYYSQCLPGSGNYNSDRSKTTTVTEKQSNGKKTATKKTTKKAVAKTTTAAKPAATKGSSSSGKAGYSIIRGGITGSTQTTRYWDCCKPSCAWNGKAKVTKPVNSCAKDGVTIIDNNIQSGCASGGSAFVCNDNQPWVVNDQLAYGFAAASIAGSTEGGWCCACYELTFTNTAAKGKKFVVQITNTGDDLGAAGKTSNHFDLMFPGGGVGIFNGCQPQWNAPSEGWGVRYGGVGAVSDCNSLPSQLQSGCKWRFGWFMGADNPDATIREVTCPAEIVAKSGCKRL